MPLFDMLYKQLNDLFKMLSTWQLLKWMKRTAQIEWFPVYWIIQTIWHERTSSAGRLRLPVELSHFTRKGKRNKAVELPYLSRNDFVVLSPEWWINPFQSRILEFLRKEIGTKSLQLGHKWERTKNTPYPWDQWWIWAKPKRWFFFVKLVV